MSAKKGSSKLSSSDLNDIVSAKPEKQLLEKLETATNNIRTSGAGKISSKSFCSFLNRFVKISANSTENTEVQMQYLELLGDVLICESCGSLLQTEAAKISATFCQVSFGSS
eukprot:gb/GECG01003253.1/.p1 GENE.gb/GECG01003253.1/~~gb/GECG01003253.1/.p1  ORF type:complete len:112 (+),score=17.22 gb/GECG01003253.1/:1-336(+)